MIRNVSENSKKSYKMDSPILQDPGSRDMVCLSEIIKNRFYFATFKTRRTWQNSKEIHYFSTDEELVYQNFFSDFGPLNLACVYRYYVKMKSKLDSPAFKDKKIVHCTTLNKNKRVNAALLVGCFSIIYLKIPPHHAYQTLLSSKYPFESFQDATVGSSLFHISLLDCLTALHKACLHNLVDFEDFDVNEFEKYDKIQNGDMNWVVPQKMLAFSGPTKNVNSAYHRPEFYLEYFQKNNIKTVVRLNRNVYDAKKFSNTGIEHHDLYFVDGSAPPQTIMHQFLEISENTPHGIAVHCKAGLGRTGTLIGAYIMKHYQMTALEAISWIRICRPGSVIGHQQAWLEEMQTSLWMMGDAYRIINYGGKSRIPHHKYGIYSILRKNVVEKETAMREGSVTPSVSSLMENLDETTCGGLIGKQQQIIGENTKINTTLTEKPDGELQEVEPSPKWLLDYLRTCKSDTIKPPYINSARLLAERAGSSTKNFDSQGDRLMAVKTQRQNRKAADFSKSREKRKSRLNGS